MALNKKPSLETLAAWEDIRISRKEDLLILENSKIRRSLDLSRGAPRTVSLQTADGTELASAKNPIWMPFFPGPKAIPMLFMSGIPVSWSI